MLYIILATLVLLALVLPAWEHQERGLIPGHDLQDSQAPRRAPNNQEGAEASIQSVNAAGVRWSYFNMRWYTSVLGDI